jgi:hypothetical protein
MPLSSQVPFSMPHSQHSEEFNKQLRWVSKFLRRRPRARSAILEMCNFEKGSDPDYLSARSILINSIGSGKMMVEFCSAAISVSVCR